MFASQMMFSLMAKMMFALQMMLRFAQIKVMFIKILKGNKENGT